MGKKLFDIATESNKSRDDEYFNCSEEYEINYVVSRYAENTKDAVRHIIQDGCKSGVIKYWTHKQLYEYIERELNKKGARLI